MKKANFCIKKLPAAMADIGITECSPNVQTKPCINQVWFKNPIILNPK